MLLLLHTPSLYALFPARAPKDSDDIAADPERYGNAETGEGWSAGRQAAMQAAALGLTIAMAIVGGIITGQCRRARSGAGFC